MLISATNAIAATAAAISAANAAAAAAATAETNSSTNHSNNGCSKSSESNINSNICAGDGSTLSSNHKLDNGIIASTNVGGIDCTSVASGAKNQKDSSCSSISGNTSAKRVGPLNINDPRHWSKHDRYDTDTLLENAYKKHLSRHANK